MKANQRARHLYLLIRNEIEYLEGTEAHKDIRARECTLIALEHCENICRSLFYMTEDSLLDQYLKQLKHEINQL
jgi:hypothetical protein